MRSQYGDSRAVWQAVTDRAKKEARARNLEPSAVVRTFVVDRFLARVFTLPEGQWVMKGGNAVLARVQNARTTKDLDLLAELDSLESAIAHLRTATVRDLSDHFRFVIKSVKRLGGDQQPGVIGCRVSVDAYCGATRRQAFGIDVVIGSLMTAEADVLLRPSLLPSITGPKVRLYPIVDHMADKIAATQSMYGTAGDKPSSRVRDLVDLVVFARTQTLDGSELQVAIDAEWNHRGLLGKPCFDPPPHWERLYQPIAARVPACGGIVRYSDAVDLIDRLLSPVFTGSVAGLQWVPLTGTWDRAAHRPGRT